MATKFGELSFGACFGALRFDALKFGVSKMSAILRVALPLLLAGSLAGMAAAQQKPDEIPDAPSATRPIPPPEPPSPRQAAEDEAKENATSPDTPAPNPGLVGIPRSGTEATDESSAPPPPMPPIKTVPAGSVDRDVDTGEDVGFTIKKYTTLVLVPVPGKNHDGALPAGFRPRASSATPDQIQ